MGPSQPVPPVGRGVPAPGASPQETESSSDLIDSNWQRLLAVKTGYEEKLAREQEEAAQQEPIQLAPEEQERQDAVAKARAEQSQRQELARSGHLPRAKVVYLSPEESKSKTQQPAVAVGDDDSAIATPVKSEGDAGSIDQVKPVETEVKHPESSDAEPLLQQPEFEPIQARETSGEEPGGETPQRPELARDEDAVEATREPAIRPAAIETRVAAAEADSHASPIQAQAPVETTPAPAIQAEIEPIAAQQHQTPPPEVETVTQQSVESEPDSVKAGEQPGKKEGFGSRLMDAARSLFGREEKSLKPASSDVQKSATVPPGEPSITEDKGAPVAGLPGEDMERESFSEPEGEETSASISESIEPVQRLEEATPVESAPVEETPEETPRQTAPLATKTPQQPAPPAKKASTESPVARATLEKSPVMEFPVEPAISSPDTVAEAPAGEARLAEGQPADLSEAAVGQDTELAGDQDETLEETISLPESGEEISGESSPMPSTPVAREIAPPVLTQTDGVTQPAKKPEDIGETPTSVQPELDDLIAPPPAVAEDEAETTMQPVPLEMAWPVERVEPVVESRPPTPRPTSQQPVIQRKPAADDQLSSDLQDVLSEVAAGQATDSAIELVTPRRPRPTLTPVQRAPAKEAQPGEVQSSPEEEPARLRQTEPSPAETTPPAKTAERWMVPTEIGDLPSDLWEFMGETPPAPEPPGPEMPGTSEAPGSKSVQRTAVKPETAKKPEPLPDPTLQEPSEKQPDAAPESQPPPPSTTTTKPAPVYLDAIAPTVQRTEAPSGSGDSEGTAEGGESQESGEGGESEESGKGGGKPDPAALARQVFPIIKRMLVLEQERKGIR
jgi:hypothetical protein